MKTTIQKWGNSQGVRIPKAILDTVEWKENEKIQKNCNYKILKLKNKKSNDISEKMLKGLKSISKI